MNKNVQDIDEESNLEISMELLQLSSNLLNKAIFKINSLKSENEELKKQLLIIQGVKND